jgi:hypothetical protein
MKVIKRLAVLKMRILFCWPNGNSGLKPICIIELKNFRIYNDFQKIMLKKQRKLLLKQ